jgi:hypothetical protein
VVWKSNTSEGGGKVFYCEDCAKASNLPATIKQSYGPCELCSKVTQCYDKASETLPLTVPTTRRIREWAKEP